MSAAAVPHRIRWRTAAIALGIGVLTVATPPALDAARAQGPGPHVLVGTTGNDSKLRETVPITRREGKKPRVVMSLGPGSLPSLSSGDRLQTTAEVEVTTDCVEKMPRCVGKPYDYNPIVGTRLLLANGPLVAGGEGSVELDSRRQKCRQRPPNRVHHCVIVFTNTILEIADQSQLPCAPGACYLNMVVQAHNERKKKGKKGRRNKLLIGEDEPDGSVLGDRGRLNAIRFSPASQPGFPPLSSTTPLVPDVSIRKGEKVTVYSQELSGLRKDEQLAVNATMVNDISNLSYNVRIKSRVVLAPSPTATGSGKEVKRLTEPAGEIAEGTGFNCTQRRPLCATTKVGVISMTGDAEDGSGDPVPLYVNLTVDAARPGGAAKPGDLLPISPGGSLGVARYPASLKG